jgi:hypothetical protein
MAHPKAPNPYKAVKLFDIVEIKKGCIFKKGV